MRIGGFRTVERGDKTYQRQVYRQRDRLLAEGPVQQLFPVAEVSVPASAYTEGFRQRTVTTAPIQQKIGRSTAKQTNNKRKAKAARKKLRDHLFKQACQEWQEELAKKKEAETDGYKYKTKSPETICASINNTVEARDNDIKLVSKSVRAAVREGRHMLHKPGEKGSIPLKCYEALCGAVSSYMILAQQAGTMAASVLRPILVKKVNTCVNKKEGLRRRNNRKLFERIQADIADDVDVGKANRVEQRRNKWSTHSNINLWFSSFKAWLIDMGFAVAAPPEDGSGELLWVSDDQGSRIANMDETGLVLDNTENGKGGRPAVAFYNPRIAKAPTQAAHKSSYHCTMVSGGFASGEKFPEHFQLPSDAQLDNQGFGIDFIEDMHSTRGRYLNHTIAGRLFSSTYGVNEKGGMNKDDFGEYIMKNFVPLVINDCADVDGKRVVLLVDGGPGRTNEEMLIKLKLLGIYLYPAGPPNTTHILQVSETTEGKQQLLLGLAMIEFTPLSNRLSFSPLLLTYYTDSRHAVWYFQNNVL